MLGGKFTGERVFARDEKTEKNVYCGIMRDKYEDWLDARVNGVKWRREEGDI